MINNVSDLRKVLEVFENYEPQETPNIRRYMGDWREVIVPVGRDCSLYITVNEEDYKELCHMVEGYDD